MDEQSNPFESPVVRALVGLSGASVAAVIGVLYFEGLVRWMIIGIAVVDAVVTPYILKRVAVEGQQSQNDPTV